MPIDYNRAQEVAMHYNIKIWTVFSVGIALSLWILYKIWVENSLEEIIKIAMLTLGYLVLIYCTLAVESFGQKKDLYYKIKNTMNTREGGGIGEETLINRLPSRRTLEYWETGILSLVFIFYIVSLIIMGLSYPFIVGFISAFMVLGYIHVLKNWIKGYNFRDKLKQNPLDQELTELFNNL